MKKILLIGAVLLFTSCTEGLNPEDILSKQMNPYKEYEIKDKAVAEVLENGILEREVENKKLDVESSSAHLISFKKLGEYGTGEVRILGNLTEEGLKEANKNKNKYQDKITNKIVNYTCTVEYSYKTGWYSWNSDYPY